MKNMYPLKVIVNNIKRAEKVEEKTNIHFSKLLFETSKQKGYKKKKKK